MNYASIEGRFLTYPASDFDSFSRRAKALIEQFSIDNAFLELIRDSRLEIGHVHSLLNTLFHQVYNSSSSFALAGAMCDGRYFKIREYLFHHAEEEQDHWKWIIQNLEDTGFSGPDPRECFPAVATQAYVSFAMYLAHKQPPARLAMAYVLEALSGAHGQQYGATVVRQLSLAPEQVSFFLLHGELDKGHSGDILEVLKEAPLTSYEWAWCEYAAETTLQLYKSLYNHAAKAIEVVADIASC